MEALEDFFVRSLARKVLWPDAEDVLALVY